ncbi:putative fungal pheromone GPCR, STE3-type [Mycena belliarum]|uniref:Fungal pheromone GPCR, STE3-type n=1 Tax=Mycena belliarum TaxID=1033014 RepID=A0AAD6XQI8_9AGAR|nr:putative fungal pheromone GPCR, STE3-type [Mycena belliae]
MHYELPIGAFAAALLVLVPLPWHWRARNVPTLSIIAWLFFSNIMLAVNAIIWADNINITAQVWCDIATKFQIGATMALPACCLCLCIHLERIASVRQVRTTVEQKRRRMLFDLAMCWGVPIISMVLHYVVQGHRFDIVEDFGCRPATYISIAAIFLVWVPQLVVVALTLAFAGAALYHFFRRRLTFARHLQDTQSALTPGRYFRLMAMALSQMIWATFLTITNMVLTVGGGLRPWTSWADVHSNFGRIAVFPTVFIPETQWRWTYFIFWTVPLTALMFFAFFAFGQDAVKEYRAVFGAVRRIAHLPEKEKAAPAHTLPSFTRLPAPKRMSGRGASSDFGTHTDKTLHSKPQGDFPLTPRSTSSFGTSVPEYDARDYGDVHSLHKPASLSDALPPRTHDAHDMA